MMIHKLYNNTIDNVTNTGTTSDNDGEDVLSL